MIDLHLHTTASDGTLAPADLVARAAQARLSTISVTDHDTVAGYAEARDAAERLSLTLVPGIEITAIEDGRDVHLLGYYFDPGSAPLAEFLQQQRRNRIVRAEQISERLRQLGYAIDTRRLLDQAERLTGRSIGRPQVADALVEAGHVRTRDEAFERFLGAGRPAFIARCGEPPEHVVEIVRGAGGIVSLAHPGLLGMDHLIPRLAGAGLTAIEVVHSEHSLEHERRYRETASAHGLAVSGGSDYHGDHGRRAAAFGVLTLPPDDFERLRARAA